MVPCEKILTTAREKNCGRHRPQRPYHAVAGRDGPCRQGDGARRASRHPAPHRRRDHEQGPHRREKSRSTTARRSMHVLDASRAVNVVSALLSDEQKPAYLAQTQQRGARKAPHRTHGRRRSREKLMLTLDEAPQAPSRLSNRLAHRRHPAAPEKSPASASFERFPARGHCANSFRLVALLPCVGAARSRYPSILDHEKYGVEARKLFNDAQALLDKIVGEKTLHAPAASTASGPRNCVGDDIELYTDVNRSSKVVAAPVLHFLRQQMEKKPAGEPNWSLSDFIAPKSHGAQSHSRPRRRVRRHRRFRKSKSSPRNSRPTTTITTRSWPRPWQTVSPRRLPSASTSASARNGATERPKISPPNK